jgi:hypothetical protein
MLYRVTMSESIDITGVKCATEPLDLLRQRVLYDAAERVARNLRKNHCHVATSTTWCRLQNDVQSTTFTTAAGGACHEDRHHR